MIELLFTMLLGIIAGIMAGLLPGIPVFLGFMLFLPFVPVDPLMIVIYGIVMNIGTQFFGSMSALYFKVPGESSSFPILLELKNFNTPEKIHRAIKLTTLGSLIATTIAATGIWLSLYTNIFSKIYMPLWLKLSIFIFLLILSIIHDRKYLINFLMLLTCLFFVFYADVVIYINSFTPQADSILPIYYFNSMLALIILFVFQLIWTKPIKLQKATESKKSSYPVIDSIPMMIKYSFVGTVLGFIPQLGATISSYISYNWEKFKKRDSFKRITASETANNSAIISCWFPLLLMGVPITASELLLVQHFNKFGFNFSFLKSTDAQLILLAAMLAAGVIYYMLSVMVNHKMYNILGKLITRRWFSIALAFSSITIFYFIDRHSLNFILIHLLMFVPLSWLINKLEINMLAIVIGLLLIKDILFTFQQLIQIYF
jgi:putative tricarboxylic transport membrane protein